MADEIGRAMQKVGGSAGALQIPFEKVASWIAVVSSRTRESAETIGNSVKAIIARVQSLKERGYDSEDGTTYNEVTKSLASVGIQATDTAGNFRNFGEVMDELGAKWNTLSGKQKAYVSTTVAGSYQSARFLNIMEGYPDSVDLYTKSLDQNGIAQEKFNRYQEGTEAQLTRMKNAWTGVFQDTFQSDGINSAIQALTGLGVAIDSLVKHIGAFPIIMNLAGIAALAFSATLRKSFTQMASGSVVYKGLTSWIEKLDFAMKGSGDTTKALTGVAYGWRAAALTAATATRALASAFLPMLALTAVTIIIEKVVSAINKHREAVRALREEENKIVDSVANHSETVNELIWTYEQLNNKTNRTEEEELKYKETIQTLSEMMPNLVSSIDEKGDAHLKNSKAIQDELKWSKLLAENQAAQDAANAGKTISSALKKYNKQKTIKESNELSYSLSWGANAPSAESAKDSNEYKLYLVRQREVLEMDKKIAEASQDAREAVRGLFDVFAQTNKFEMNDNVKKQLDDLTDSLDLNSLKGKESGKVIEAIVNDLQEIKTNGVKGATLAVDDLKLALEQLGMSGKFQPLIDSLKEIAPAAEEAELSVMSFSEASKSLNEAYDKSASKLEILNGMLEDNARGKKVSAEEAMKLVEQDASMVDMFKIENGIITLNIQAIKNKKAAEIDAFKAVGIARGNDVKNQAQATIDKVKGYGYELEAINNISKALNDINDQEGEQINDLLESGKYAAIPGVQENAHLARYNILQYKKEMDDIQKQAEFAAAALNSVGKSKTDPKEKAAKKDVEEYNSKRTALDDLNDEIQHQQNITATLTVGTKAYNDSLHTTIGLLGQKKIEAHKEADDLRKTEASLVSQIGKMGDFNKLSNENKEKLNDLKQQLDDTRSSITAMSDAYYDAQSQMQAARWDLVESGLSGFTKALETNQNNLDLSQAKMGSYNEDSKEYRKELNYQIGVMKNRQSVLHDEAEYVREQLKNDKLTVEQKAQLTETLRGLTIEWWNLNSAIKQNTDEMKAQREQIADDAIQAIKDAIQAQADAVSDYIDKQNELLDEAHDKEMDRLDEEQDRYEKLINAKLRKLDELSEKRRYDQDLSDKEQERQEILNKINLLQMDNSEEGKAQLKELQKQLKDVNRDIDNMKFDHDVDQQKQQLQDELDASKEATEKAKEDAKFSIDLWDEVEQKKITISGKTYDELKKYLDEFKDKQEQHYKDILNDEEYFAKLKKDIVNGNVNETVTKLKELKSWFNTNLPDIGEVIQKNLINKMQEFIDKLNAARSLQSTIDAMKANSTEWLSADSKTQADLAKENENLASNIGATKDKNGNWVDQNGNVLYSVEESKYIEAMQANSKAWLTADATERKRLEALNKSLASHIQGAYLAANGKWMRNGVPLYHEGGIVGGGGSGVSNLVNKMFNAAPNEQVILALQDELMVPSQNIVKNFIPNLTRFIQTLVPSFPSGTAAASASGGGINIYIDNVTGDKKGANLVAKTIVTEIKKLGGNV